MKRILSLLLCLMCISMIAVPVFAEMGLDDFRFRLQGGEDTGTSSGPTTAIIQEINKSGNSGDGGYETITEEESLETAWTELYNKYRHLINFAYGAMMLTCLGGLVVAIITFGTAGGNPGKRQQAMMGMLFCGLGIALLGSVGIWFAFAMNVL